MEIIQLTKLPHVPASELLEVNDNYDGECENCNMPMKGRECKCENCGWEWDLDQDPI